MARRRSHIAKRLQKMIGVPSAEKHLLIRVGELIDGVINNRTPTNPFERGRTRSKRGLPPPNTITNETGVRSAKLTWPAINSSLLNHYKITVISFEDGTEEEFISYTNSFTFKGREGGNYRAMVQSVGRDGTQSVPNIIDFFITENVMLLEGAKNSVDVIGPNVSEDLFLSEGHVIFVWGAFTIDRLIGGASVGNPEAAIQLYRVELGKTIEEAELIEEIPLFAATESATNLDVDALGGGITRPSLSGTALTNPDFVRGSTFETCHSVMFTPITVTTELANKKHTFFLEVIGRELPNDITGLSITLWSANAGLASQIPADPFEPEPAIVDEWPDCVQVHTSNDATGRNWLHDTLPANFNFIGDTFTFACWVKWRRLGYDINQAATLVTRWRPVTVSPFGFDINSFRVTITRNTDVVIGPFNYVSTNVRIGGSRNGATGSPVDLGEWEARDQTFNGNPNNFLPGSNPPYLSPLTSVWGNLNGWVFFAFTYTPTLGVEGYSLRAGRSINTITPTTNTTVGVPCDTSGNRSMAWFGLANSLYLAGIFQGADNDANQPANLRIHQAGMWNKKLDAAEITALYNNGDGAAMNWRTNDNGYSSSGNLLHYWQFAAIPDVLKYVARDTGINPLGSGGNDGDLDLTETGANPPTTQVFCEDFTLANVVEDAPTN